MRRIRTVRVHAAPSRAVSRRGTHGTLAVQVEGGLTAQLRFTAAVAVAAARRQRIGAALLHEAADARVDVVESRLEVGSHALDSLEHGGQTILLVAVAVAHVTAHVIGLRQLEHRVASHAHRSMFFIFDFLR